MTNESKGRCMNRFHSSAAAPTAAAGAGGGGRRGGEATCRLNFRTIYSMSMAP